MDDAERIPCPVCGKEIVASAIVCRFCGEEVGERPPARKEGDATGGVIPYKNVPALIAYYCGVFSILPCFPIGIVAFVLGIMGLKKAKREPQVRGQAHAWIGIIVGGIFGLVYTVLTGMGIIAAIAAG